MGLLVLSRCARVGWEGGVRVRKAHMDGMGFVMGSLRYKSG